MTKKQDEAAKAKLEAEKSAVSMVARALAVANGHPSPDEYALLAATAHETFVMNGLPDEVTDGNA